MVQKVKSIWLDGKLIPWEEANVHILTHTLHYGLGVFEGIRCYKTHDQRSAIFRLSEHIHRLFDSAMICFMKIPFSEDEISGAILETLKANGMQEGYIRPLVFIGDEVMGLHPQNNPIRVAIITWPWGAYLGEEGLTKGIRVKVSSITRHHVNVNMTKAKVCGNYVNSIMAKLEVTRAGYDEALMLDTDGYVAEASGENIFIVTHGLIRTTPLTSVLAGITRDSIIVIARKMGYTVVEERFSRDEVYTCDEAFLTGTAAEITPIREVDDRPVGRERPGPITKRLQEAFFNTVKGKDRQFEHWLTYL
jgi:branched-chain amino acid aminotransferase